MNDLINEVIKQLGVDEPTAKNATGAAMALLRDNVGDDLFAKIGHAVPGAGDLADQAPAASAHPADDGGLLGSLAEMASKALVGDASKGIDLGAVFGESGLPLDKIGPFVATVVGFLKKALGEDAVAQILDKLPLLKPFVD